MTAVLGLALDWALTSNYVVRAVKRETLASLIQQAHFEEPRAAILKRLVDLSRMVDSPRVIRMHPYDWAISGMPAAIVNRETGTSVDVEADSDVPLGDFTMEIPA